MNRINKDTNHPIVSESGTQYDYQPFTVKMFLNRSTIFYGESGTGKSYLLNDYLKVLANEVFCMIAISRTGHTDKSFPLTEYTPTPLIYTRLNPEILESIYKAAEKRAEIYREVNKIENLEKGLKVILDVYKKNDDYLYKKTRNYAQSIRKYRKKHYSNAESKNEKLKAEVTLVKMYRYLLKKGYKYISDNKIDLLEAYSESDLISVIFCKLNPNILILFNDVGDDVKTMKKAHQAYISNLFSMGRHLCITVCFLLQNITQVDPGIRKNANINIFTEERVINAIVDSNKLKHERKRFEDAAKTIIVEDMKKPPNQRTYTKILYDKESGSIKYVKADKLGEQTMVGDKHFTDYLKKRELDKSSMIAHSMLKNF
ncbi:MAG: hypothetical protein CMM93_07000 [Rickettsiales bacterium]|nr:hypothetical protein [Rickettsiales bacterium]|tara:strand:+ start:2023 stop:3138 length:1116 start_codon:yes stop_codon:yes gene_type:complete